MTYPSEDVPVDPSYDPDLIPPDGILPARKTENRRIVGELIATVEEPADERLTLTHEERQNFTTLVNVGRRVKTVTIADHQVTIKTLKSVDEMRIGIFTKPYLDTQGFARAYQTAVCACGIVEIAGQDLWQSLKEITDPEELFALNVKALSEFYPIVITQIYQAIMELEKEFAQLAIKLGKIGDPAKK